MDKNMANRMCCDLDIRDYYTKAPILKVDFCNTTTYNFTSDSIYVRRNGARYFRIDAPVEGNIDITFQVHPFQIYSLLTGGKILSDGVVARCENITAVTDGALRLKHSPISGSVFVYPYNDFTGEEIKGSVDGKNFISSEIKENKTYAVGYLQNKSSGVKRISFSYSNISAMYFIQMITMNKTEDGEESAMRLTAYKCCPKRELEINFSSDDSPAEIIMSFDCFQDNDENIMDILELDDDDIPEEDDIWINFETGTLETYSPAYYIQNGYLLQNDIKEDDY